MRAIYHDSRESVCFEKKSERSFLFCPHNPMFEKNASTEKFKCFFELDSLKVGRTGTAKKLNTTAKPNVILFFIL